MEESPRRQSPGPNLPMSPPRRRSSLFFSKILPSSPPVNDIQDGADDSVVDITLPAQTPSSTGRKRSFISPKTRSVPPPGHVAQMQKIFQHAKASLHLDARFAASPIGSLDSRLPSQSPETISDKEAEHNVHSNAEGSPNTNWRYSTAPQLLATAGLDVREPMPDASPRLPELHLYDIVQPLNLDPEPISSGFASPITPALPDEHSIGHAHQELTPEPCLPTSELDSNRDEDLQEQQRSVKGATTLEQDMTNLKIDNDKGAPDHEMEDPPVEAHLSRTSADIAKNGSPAESSASSSEIFLSPTAQAAADFAKAKRGLLRGLLSLGTKKRVRNAYTLNTPAAEHVTVETKCPDPELHQHELSACPDPTAHRICPDPTAHTRSETPFTYTPPDISVTPASGMMPGNVPSPHPLRELLHPPQLHHHVTSTGSPIMRRPPSSAQPDLPSYPRRTYHSSPSRPNYCMPRSARPRLAPGSQMASEHFEPGWYYAKDNDRHPNEYSFSTAAAKVTGAPTDPDSRIRDSYRTDTLTGLFIKPTPRFRKTGMAAAVNSGRGVSKYYAATGYEAAGNRPVPRRPKRARQSPDLRFGSSPPKPLRATSAVSKKRRTLESREEVIEVDEETRAAVRLSLYGAEALGSAVLQEVNPNVNRQIRSSPVKGQASETAEIVSLGEDAEMMED